MSENDIKIEEKEDITLLEELQTKVEYLEVETMIGLDFRLKQVKTWIEIQIEGKNKTKILTRYELRQGAYNPYIYDTKEKRMISLDVITRLLNKMEVNKQ